MTVLNTGPQDVDLAGWALADLGEHRMALPSGVLRAGETARIPVEPPVLLGPRAAC